MKGVWNAQEKKLKIQDKNYKELSQKKLDVTNHPEDLKSRICRCQIRLTRRKLRMKNCLLRSYYELKNA